MPDMSNLWVSPSAAALDALAEAHRVISAVPPAQVHEGEWWQCGPTNPPDESTVMSAACWYAASPEGAARGLYLDPSVKPPRNVNGGTGGFESLGRALGVGFSDACALFCAEVVTLVGGHRDAARNAPDMVLKRLAHVLTHHGRAPTGRRVLSSR